MAKDMIRRNVDAHGWLDGEKCRYRADLILGLLDLCTVTFVHVDGSQFYLDNLLGPYKINLTEL